MTTRFAYYCTKKVMMHFCSIFHNKHDSVNMGKLSPKVDGKKWKKAKKSFDFFRKM